MNPEVWGPRGWFFLDSICMAYPDRPSPQDAARMRAFFLAVPHVLPCPACRAHFLQNMLQDPIEPALATRESLVNWILRMHNRVRAKNGQTPISLADFYQYYSQEYSEQLGAERIVGPVLGFVSGVLLARYL